MKELALSIHKLQDGRFQISYINPITRKRKRHRFDESKSAKVFKSEIERQYSNKNYGYFMETFVSQVIEQHLKENPESKLREQENVFRSFCSEFSHLRINQLNRMALKNWFEKIRIENNYSERTLNSIKSLINAFFRPLVEDGLLSESPLSKIKFKRSDPRRSRIVLAVEEVNQLLENAKTFSPIGLYPFLSAIAHTGARRGEILALNVKDIDFSTHLIHIKKSKNGRDRFIRMSPTLASVLKERVQHQAGETLFINEYGRKLDSNKELTRLINKFKAFFPMDKNWGCHALRHSFARNFLMQGRQMYQLQAILGHRSINVTIDLYGQLQAQDIECPSPYEGGKEGV